MSGWISDRFNCHFANLLSEVLKERDLNIFVSLNHLKQNGYYILSNPDILTII